MFGYADDLVMISEEEKGMRCLLKRLKGYLDGKGLVVNVEKTKIIKFGKGLKRRVR